TCLNLSTWQSLVTTGPACESDRSHQPREVSERAQAMPRTTGDFKPRVRESARKENRKMIKFLLTIVVTLSSIALANTGTYSPTIDDTGFSYYRPSGSTANTTISYWTIGVQDDKLVVRISHEAST